MAIDIYNIFDKGHKNILYSISEMELEGLGNILEICEEKTGVFIDPYGTTRLTHGHIKLLFNMIKPVENTNDNSSRFFQQFYIFLEKAYLKGQDLILEGD